MNRPDGAAEAQSIDHQPEARESCMRDPHHVDAVVVFTKFVANRIHTDDCDAVSACSERAPERGREGADSAVETRRVLAAEETDVHVVPSAVPMKHAGRTC
jgi:hypothetical protein